MFTTPVSVGYVAHCLNIWGYLQLETYMFNPPKVVQCVCPMFYIYMPFPWIKA